MASGLAGPVVAAVLHEAGGQFMLEEIELDDLRAGELLVQVEACGVCHTDVQGKTLLEPPCVLGHEGTGTVVACGPGVDEVSPGDCVVMSYPRCGTCRQCLDDQPFHCPSNLSLSLDGRRSDGSRTMRLGSEWINGAWFQQSAFATHAIVPARSVIVVDPSVPLQIRAVLGCGILTGAGAVVNALALDGASSLAVVGVGGVGMAAVMAAHLTGTQPLIAVDVVTARLDTALELGATHVLDVSAGDPTDQIRAIAKEGIDAVIDTSGSPTTWQWAPEVLRPGGTFAAIPLPKGDFAYEVAPLFRIPANLRVVRLGESAPHQFIPQLIDWYTEGRFPLDQLVETFPLEGINDAFDASTSGRVIKPVVVMTP